jgi:hypothetical protein
LKFKFQFAVQVMMLLRFLCRGFPEVPSVPGEEKVM